MGYKDKWLAAEDAPESLDDGGLVLVVGPDGDERLPDPDPGDGALGLAEGATHASLEPERKSWGPF